MSYETKGTEKQVYDSGMQRDTTTGKIRYDLMYMPLIRRYAGVMTRGAERYGDKNWMKASTQEELDRFKESAFRHFMQWYLGENCEEDHAAGLLFNIAGAEYMTATHKQLEWYAEPGEEQC